MVQEKQKQIEKYYTQKFIENYDLEVQIEGIFSLEKDPPDIVAVTSKGNISIEFTELVNAKDKGTESLKQELLDEAKKIFFAKHDEKIDVTVIFTNQPIKCSQSKIPLKAIEIFEIVEQIYLERKNQEFDYSTRTHSDVSEMISWIQVTNTWNSCFWQYTGAHIVGDGGNQFLIDRIKAKDKKLDNYKDFYVENWLLMYLDGGNKSSMFDFLNLAKVDFETSFDRIFIYSYRYSEMSELKIKKVIN